MAFKGWPTSMVEFYSELEVNNSKEFWTANKDVYDTDVKAPMAALVEELAEEYGEAKIFRPYRDVRFSKDKTPYKTQIAAAFHTADGGGFYVRASADGLGAGGGYYMMAADQLDRFRNAIDDDRAGAELAELVTTIGGARGYEVHSDSLKTAPRGWPKDHERIDLLRRKSLTWMREAAPGPRVHTRKAVAFVRDTFAHGAPLLKWLDTHVGSSTKPRRGR